MYGKLNYIKYGDGREVRLSYNSLRQLEEIHDWIGVTKITNDALGRTTEVQYPDGKKVAYTYGISGKRTSLTYPDGETVYYGYDMLCRLSEIRERDAYIRYQYDDLGMLTEKIFSNGMTTSYEYDARGLLVSLVHKDNEGVLDAYNYQYDLAANRTEIIKNRRGLPEESGRYNYEYDVLGRLNNVIKDGEILRKYEYDAYGNRISLIENNMTKTYHYNALNQPISTVDITAEGQTEEQFSYDKRGNLTQILLNGQVKNQYAYGALNRLEWAENANGEEVSYIYNGLGNRIGKQEKRQEKQGTYSDRKIDYVIDLTKQYNNLLQKEEEGKRQTFLWDNNVAGIIDADSSYEFYFQDELGSPIRLADEEGNLQDSYGYDEFGQDLYHNQGLVQPFGYTGYQMENITGTYFAQAREYMPSVGKFASRDLDKFISIKNMHSVNLYNYCMSNPVRYIDPSGNDLEDKYPLAIKNKNDAVQISVSGNDITINVYVDFVGNEDLTTYGGTSCKDLAIAGIESWSGYYLDVFGEDVQVTVNVHEGDSSFWNSQKYIKIYLEENFDIPHTNFGGHPWNCPSDCTIYMYRWDPRNDLPYPEEEYARTITHEMGHVFGIDDGYEDTSGKTTRPDAYKLKVIDEYDVMRSQFKMLNVSNTDIGMLILAYSDYEYQSYADYTRSDYTSRTKSKYFEQEGKE